MFLATFSSNGPEKCSGLEVTRYDVESVKKAFNENFVLKNHLITNHPSPFNTTQEFLFAIFSKK